MIAAAEIACNYISPHYTYIKGLTNHTDGGQKMKFPKNYWTKLITAGLVLFLLRMYGSTGSFFDFPSDAVRNSVIGVVILLVCIVVGQPLVRKLFGPAIKKAFSQKNDKKN